MKDNNQETPKTPSKVRFRFRFKFEDLMFFQYPILFIFIIKVKGLSEYTELRK